jgi:hypothetical protein
VGDARRRRVPRVVHAPRGSGLLLATTGQACAAAELVHAAAGRGAERVVVARGLLARTELAPLARARRVPPVRPARALRFRVPGESGSALSDAPHKGIRGST